MLSTIYLALNTWRGRFRSNELVGSKETANFFYSSPEENDDVTATLPFKVRSRLSRFTECLIPGL